MTLIIQDLVQIKEGTVASNICGCKFADSPQGRKVLSTVRKPV